MWTQCNNLCPANGLVATMSLIRFFLSISVSWKFVKALFRARSSCICTNVLRHCSIVFYCFISIVLYRKQYLRTFVQLHEDLALFRWSFLKRRGRYFIDHYFTVCVWPSYFRFPFAHVKRYPGPNLTLTQKEVPTWYPKCSLKKSNTVKYNVKMMYTIHTWSIFHQRARSL
jgi:hypothetical protein